MGGLFIPLLIYPGSPSAERRGADLMVTLKDGKTISGELIAVKRDSLLLFNSSQLDISVDVSDISKIKVVRKSKALKGLGLGFLSEFAAGAVVGYVTNAGHS